MPTPSQTPSPISDAYRWLSDGDSSESTVRRQRLCSLRRGIELFQFELDPDNPLANVLPDARDLIDAVKLKLAEKSPLDEHDLQLLRAHLRASHDGMMHCYRCNRWSMANLFGAKILDFTSLLMSSGGAEDLHVPLLPSACCAVAIKKFAQGIELSKQGEFGKVCLLLNSSSAMSIARIKKMADVFEHPDLAAIASHMQTFHDHCLRALMEIPVLAPHRRLDVEYRYPSARSENPYLVCVDIQEAQRKLLSDQGATIDEGRVNIAVDIYGLRSLPCEWGTYPHTVANPNQVQTFVERFKRTNACHSVSDLVAQGVRLERFQAQHIVADQQKYYARQMDLARYSWQHPQTESAIRAHQMVVNDAFASFEMFQALRRLSPFRKLWNAAANSSINSLEQSTSSLFSLLAAVSDNQVRNQLLLYAHSCRLKLREIATDSRLYSTTRQEANLVWKIGKAMLTKGFVPLTPLEKGMCQSQFLLEEAHYSESAGDN